MRWRAAVVMAAIMSIGLSAGVYLADFIGGRPFRMAADASAAIQYQQILHAGHGLVTPPLVIGSMIASWLWLFALRSRLRSRESVMILMAVLCTTAIVVLTVAISTPLNNSLMTWNAAAPPANFHAIWAPWEQVNVARVILSILALALETGALALSPRGASSRGPVGAR